MKKFVVTYRNEIQTIVEAKNVDEAIYQAEQSSKWEFIVGEGHKDLFEVEELENDNDS